MLHCQRGPISAFPEGPDWLFCRQDRPWHSPARRVPCREPAADPPASRSTFPLAGCRFSDFFPFFIEILIRKNLLQEKGQFFSLNLKEMKKIALGFFHLFRKKKSGCALSGPRCWVRASGWLWCLPALSVPNRSHPSSRVRGLSHRSQAQARRRGPRSTAPVGERQQLVSSCRATAERTRGKLHAK